MGDKERQRETKQNHLSPASGDKSNHLSPASKHAMGDKERQSKVISAQHPDTPWETRGKEGRQSKIISAQRPDMPWETRGGTKGDKAKSSGPQWQRRGNKAKSSQPRHRDKAKSSQPMGGDKGRESSWPSIISMQELRTRHSKAAWGKT